MGERPLPPVRERLPERRFDPPWEDIGFDLAANGRWPTDAQIATASPLAASYVQALRNCRRNRAWRAPNSDVVLDRDPLPENFLPPAEALRMRELGDPLKPLTTSGGNDARK